MKQTKLWLASMVPAIVLAVPQLTPMLRAQSQTPPPSAQQQQQKTETFVGKIVKAKNGQYALLTDEQTGRGAYLDDQEKAKQFEGKNVKVTGVLEVAKDLIHVSDIQLA